MTMDVRIENLKRRHATLDEEIGGENQRPIPDQATISELKKEKLKLKDAITSLQKT